MVKTIELFKVRPGETFALDGVEFVKLGDEMYGTLVLTRDEVMGGITFEDVNAERKDHNNYRGSNLEKQCLRWLENEHPDIRTYAIPRPIDLTTMDGRTEYGAPTVLARALTVYEYRRYRYLIPHIRRWFWLATGWTTVGYSYSVFHCNPGCELHYIDVYNEASALRPALYLESDACVFVDDSEDSKGLGDCTDQELLVELLLRTGERCSIEGGYTIDIRKIRKEKGLTEAEVSARVGITQQYYNYIENGKRRPSVETAKKIAAVLGFDWTRFYEEGGEADAGYKVSEEAQTLRTARADCRHGENQ